MKIKILVLSMMVMAISIFSVNKAHAQEKIGYLSSLELLSVMPQV